MGPPLFQKLEIDTRPNQSIQHQSSAYLLESTSKTPGQTFTSSSGVSDSRETVRKENLSLKADKVNDDGKAVSLTQWQEEKPSSSELKPKEVSEAVPVQNQAAAQKLLQKMSQTTRDYQQFRGQRRGKGKQEEQVVFTLDEWERRKGEAKPLKRDGLQDISRAEIARQLQDQLDLEEYQGEMAHELDADRIKMGMFNFRRVEEDRNGSNSGFKGRGRGSGRGRRSGRRGGRGRGSWQFG